MTDTELLDGLQRLFDGHVAVLRSCSSGVKIELAHHSFRFWDVQREPTEVQEFFGGDSNGSEIGRDIRVAITRAIEAKDQ